MIEPKPYIKELFRMPAAYENRTGNVYRFDRNERTTDFPAEHLPEVLKTITPEEMSAYLEPEPLYQKLAEWLKIDRDQLLLTSGSDTAIKNIFEIYISEGDEVVTLSPTYGMYVVYCRMYGAKGIEIGYNDDLTLSVDEIIEAIGPKTKMVAIADPNHTGTVIEPAELKKIIVKAKENDALALIDEAYFHFYNETTLPLVNEYDNLIVVRTFSKAQGIAPLRLGYVISQKENIEQLFKVKLAHEVTLLAYKTAMYMLDHPEILNDNVRQVNEAKDVLYTRLPEMDFEVLRSAANFVYFKPPQGIDGQALMTFLKSKKVMLKGPFGKSPFSGHIRITVGSAEQSNMVIDLIEEYLKVNASAAQGAAS